MKSIKKLVSIVLSIVMLASLLCVQMPAFAADEATEELVLLCATKAKEVVEAMPKLESDKKNVQNSKYSAKWAMDQIGTVGIEGASGDLSAYNELKMTLYSTHATTVYIYFETKNDETDGMDAFTKQVKIKEGWQDISLDLSKISKSRKPSWKDIAGLRFNSNGWGQTPVEGCLLYFDRISLAANDEYGDPSATPTPTPTPKPEGEAGNARYYAEDFEKTDSVSVRYANDNLITLEEKDGNHYMQITKAGAADVHVSTSLKYTSRYIVMSADYATTKYPSRAQLLTCKSATAQHTFLSLTSDGQILAGGTGSKVVGTLKPDGKFVNIAIAGDFDNSRYDVYINGELVAEDVKMGGDNFGYPTLHRIYLNKSSNDAGGNLMVDNIRVFDGKKPEDFDKTISVTEAEASSLAEMIGKPSPLLDMGTFVLNQIDSEKAVVMNVRSGYIHANGKRYMPDAPAYIKDGRTLLPVRAVSEALGCAVDWNADTRTATINGKAKITIDSKEMILPDSSSYTLDVPAEITSDRTFIPLRALCEKVLGKTVFWDDRGLIILSDKELELTNDKIVSLNNYMFYDRPSGAELKDLFNTVNAGAHPRVILNVNDFARILNDYKTNALMKEWGDNVIATAEKHMASPHEEHKLVNDQLLSVSRNTLAKSLNLAMAYKLTGREEFKTYLWEEMQNVCSFADWNHHKHYLDTGEMATAVAIGYDWLYDEWTEEQRKVMEEGIYNHALVWTQKAQYGKCDYPNFFVNATTNWNAACNGGVGVGAMAVFDVYPDICSDILEKVYVGLENMMKEFYPHGAWYEGTGYTRYLVEYVTFFVSTSENTFASDFNITKTVGFEGAASYYLNSDGMVSMNNFHDSGTGHLTSSTFMWFSKYMNQPGITETLLYRRDKYNIPGDIYAFIYYDTSVAKTENVNLPLDTYFGATEITSLRSSWTDNEGIYVSMHSGETQVNHGHLDSGTFVADFGGQRFAHDLGADSYSGPGYFGTERYTYYRTRPEGHNVFVINPDKSNGQFLGVSDKITKFETKSKGGYAITELSNAYSPYAESARRGIMLSDERRSVLIRDEIRGMKKNTNEVYWFMQLMKTDVEIVDNSTVILERNGVRVKLQVLSDAQDCEIYLTDARPLPDSPDPESQNKNGGYKRLVIKFKTGKDVNINVKMSLLYDIFGDTPIVDTPLDNWSIPDGEIVKLDNPFPEFPKANGMTIDGEACPSFEKDTTSFTHVLPYGTTKVSSIDVATDEHIEVTNIVLPESIPGNAIVTLTDKNDSRLSTTYTIGLRARSEIELEASGFQEGNEPENCLDGNFDTRWAVEGDSYGIFRFANPKKLSSVWIATWKAKERKLIFDIEVSEDGENFTKVWSGQTAAVEDILEEIKIPEGIYKAVKLVFHGTTTGSWNSILEVSF